MVSVNEGLGIRPWWDQYDSRLNQGSSSSFLNWCFEERSSYTFSLRGGEATGRETVEGAIVRHNAPFPQIADRDGSPPYEAPRSDTDEWSTLTTSVRL